MKPEFLQVNAESILNLRHKVLRSGRPFSTAKFEGDNLGSTRHYAAVIESKVIGCLSLMAKNCADFTDLRQYQLRGMAIEEKYRRRNIGQQLLRYAEFQLKSKEVNLIWCNVRTSAESFYRKNGYQKIGNTFDIIDVGPHILMFKNL